MRFLKGDLFLSVFLLCLQSYTTIAQDNYRVINWNVQNGLTQSTVYCVLEDEKGFIWLTSEDGLNRFDGNYFRHFQSSLEINNRDFIGVEMIGLVEDSLHNIWIGSDEGLNRFDLQKESFTHFINKDYAESGLSNFIIPFLSTREEVWCLEVSGDITAYHTKSFKKRTVFPEVGWSVNYKAILEAKWNKIDKALWLPTNHGLLKISDNGKKKYFSIHHPSIAKNIHLNIYNLEIDYQRKCLWIGTSLGLFRKYFLSDVFDRVVIPGYDADIAIGKIAIANDKRLWIGTEEKGIIIWAPGQRPERIVRNTSSGTGLSSNHVNSIYFDKKDIVWISNGYTGVDQLYKSPTSITSYTQSALLNNSSNSSIVRTISKWPDGRIAAGTEDSGIILLDPSNNDIEYLNTTSTKNLIANYISCIKNISDTRQVLIGSYTGMQRLDLRDNKFQTIHFKLANQQKTDSVYVRHFEVWQDKWIIGTQNEGAFQLINGQDTAFQISGTQNSHVHYVGKVKEGALLVYMNKRAVIYNLDNNRLMNTPIDLKIIPLLYCYYDIKNNDYWFGTVKGLRHTDAHFKTIKDYTVSNGLPNNFIYSVVPDSEGFLWLSTNRGISRFDPKREVFYNLSPGDGLQGFEYNSKASLLDNDVTYFGGMNGFDKIKSASFKLPTYPSSVYLKAIEVNGEELAFHNAGFPLSFSYNNNSLSFSAGIIDFFNASNSSIQYKLEGAEDKWNVTQPGNLKINFASLKPGKYTLKLKSNSRLINAHETSKEYSFIIIPPFWQTWWFLVLSAAFLVGVLYLLFAYRLNQKLKILQIRDNLSRDLHDDIGGTLSSIRIYTEMLNKHPEEKTLIDLIQENVLVMLDKLEVITWASNPKNDLFGNLMKEAELFIIPLFRSNKIEYLLHTQNISGNKVISGHIRQHLFLIFKETINNTIKHSGCSKVEINIEKEKGQLVLQIKDNGKGFDINSSGKGNGLKNMKYRAQKLNGQLFLDSSSEGTSMTLKMPFP